MMSRRRERLMEREILTGYETLKGMIRNEVMIINLTSRLLDADIKT